MGLAPPMLFAKKFEEEWSNCSSIITFGESQVIFSTTIRFGETQEETAGNSHASGLGKMWRLLVGGFDRLTSSGGGRLAILVPITIATIRKVTGRHSTERLNVLIHKAHPLFKCMFLFHGEACSDLFEGVKG